MPTQMPDNEKPKHKSRKPSISKRSTDRSAPQPPAAKPRLHAEQSPSIGSAPPIVLTESEYRALVAQKAHEIYLQRSAATEVDDWLQAERIVKETLLSHGQTAGVV